MTQTVAYTLFQTLPRNATLFFALKVQYNLAQGSALGYDTTRPMRPVGAVHWPNVLYDAA